MSDRPVTSEALISIHRLELGYGTRVVFEDISFSIREGDFLGLVGPNGGGKTTLLRAILGSLEPRAGEIVQHGSDVRFGYVPQRRHLDPIWPLRTLDVVIMGTYGRAGMGRRLAPEHTDAALQALDHVGIHDLAQHRYADLSGGQQQRALVARALAAQPNFLVLDEPTQGMDLASSTGIQELIRQLHGQGITILLASHRLNVVANHVETIAFVNDGRIEVGARDELLTGEKLSALYDIPVEVIRDEHNHIVVLGG